MDVILKDKDILWARLSKYAHLDGSQASQPVELVPRTVEPQKTPVQQFTRSSAFRGIASLPG